MPENKAIRVFLADDHPLLRTGLRLSLDQIKDVELIGEAEDGFSAVEKIHADPPDVSLIDVDMPGLSGIGVIRLLRKSFPHMKILVLSTYNDDKYIHDAMQAGADGYVLKCIGIGELTKIIKSYWTGKPEISPYLVHLTTAPVTGDKKPASRESSDLTVRETEVLTAIAAGKGNKEIADMLYISLETVKSHAKHIFKKLKVKNRVEAARVAIERNVLN
ncbi:MAG: response regulator transcription factor [Desulfosarcina sp.]|nr:response regulator transcription factor [Desulfosarcina sp.]MBC2743986.1 response regulator transcription factor [Desulfosarcina sp.]MBC2766895.1 response regulator transcription factor [Desulfosarcina sp.]